ncbi:MAG: transglutaminase family protein [Promethearchaeota archaeon]
MKIKKLAYFRILCIFFLIISPFSLIRSSHISVSSKIHTSSSEEGISNYVITQNVIYNVEINFSLTHKFGFGNYMFKFSRLNNRVPNSTLTKYTPPYQEATLLYNIITGCEPSNIIMGHNDKFNNTYDSFSTSILPIGSIFLNPKVSLSQEYSVKLNEIEFQNIEISEIGLYDTSEIIFELYCNHSEPYYERDSPLLIELSHELVDPEDNPIKKAEKIFDWVSDNLKYNGNLPAQEKGALWAYNNLEGDCSEYSSLMVTLLRIQGIPARKVTGFLVSTDPNIRPKSGDTWIFYANEHNSNILAHAWVEYYVPNIGWIACDPTWNSNSDYFNKIDFLRFTTNVGANFFFPPSSIISEFSNPFFSYNLGAEYEFDYIIKITVIDSNLQPQEKGAFFIGITIIIVLGAGLTIWIWWKVKKKHKRNAF